MNTLPVETYPQRLRAYYLVVLASISRDNGEIRPDTLAHLEQKIQKFQLTRNYRDRVIAAARYGHNRLRRQMNFLKETDLRYSLMLDALALAVTSGELPPEKHEMMRRTARTMGISEQLFRLLVDFAQAAHQSSHLPSLLPTHDRAIQNLLDHLRQEQLPLLSCSTFCALSSENDARLRQRLLGMSHAAKGQG